MKAGDSMTGKSLRELRDQIPAVGGGLENRLLELSVGMTTEHLAPHMEAAALLLHEIYDALIASPQGEGWRPISEAPKDGTWIVVCGEVWQGQRPEIANWSYLSDCWQSMDDELINVSHWMPLLPLPSSPEIPKAETQEAPDEC